MRECPNVEFNTVPTSHVVPFHMKMMITGAYQGHAATVNPLLNPLLKPQEVLMLVNIGYAVLDAQTAETKTHPRFPLPYYQKRT